MSNTTPNQLKETIANWEDTYIEGYWELMDTAARANTDEEEAAQYGCLANACEEVLNERWAEK